MNNKRGRTSAGGKSGNPRASLPFQIPDLGMDTAMDDMLDDDDDEGLEAELDALMNGNEAPVAKLRKLPAGNAASPSPASRNSALHPPSSKGAGAVRKTTPSNGQRDSQPNTLPPRIMDFDLSAIERMGTDDPEDEDVDEDDPELLAELEELSPDISPGEHAPAFSPKTPISSQSGNSVSSGNTGILALLQERLENYEGAHQDALYQKEAAKVRRYDRSISTIKTQIAQAKKGQPVAEDDVPPPVFIKSVLQKSLSDAKPFPSEPASLNDKAKDIPAPASTSKQTDGIRSTDQPIATTETPTLLHSGINNSTVSALKQRREQYRHAALNASQAGNKPNAIRFMKIYKEFDIVVKAAEEGQAVDLSAMPPPPDQLSFDHLDSTNEDIQKRSPIPSGKAPPVAQILPPKAVIEDDSEIPDIDPSDVKSTFKAPDAPKTILEALTQRLNKYTSTYEEAKTAGDSAKARRMQRIVKQYQEAIKDFQAKRPVNFEELPTPPGFGAIPTGRPTGNQTATAPQHQSASGASTSSASSRPTNPPLAATSSGRESRHAQQYHLLMERQHQFKLAALKAKKEGSLETARLYLRQANGLKPMIEASANGLPVDIASIPKAPPGMGNDSDDYDVVQYEEVGAQRPVTSKKSRTEVYSQLEKDLVEQVGMCVRNVQHFKKSGDIPMAEKFEKFNLQSRKELDSLRNAFKHNAPTPRFHYETRSFSVVRCCPELPETVMELSLIRGFGYTLSGFAVTDFVTYVKWDFPFPAEAPQSGKTLQIKGTNEPEYNSTFPIQINRKSRSLARIFKTKGIKCEVYVKMGFLKADKVLGTVNISLETLETKCIHHTSLDLLDGKKAVGGKLEVRARIREPILRQQVEELREKWLVIDEFVK